MSCPSDQVMVPQVPSPVFLLPMQKAGGGQQILHSALINDLFPPLLPLRRAISGKGDWTWQGSETRRIRDQEKAVPLCHYWLLPALLGSSAPTLQGRLGYKDPRAKCFLREKKKERKKLFPSVEPKAALLIWNFLFSVTEQSGNGRNADHACPMGKNYFKQFLYNMYRARCKPAPQIQNTQQYLKTNRNRDGPLASPHRSVGGHNQAEIQSSS